jgi:hypothetical protein
MKGIIHIFEIVIVALVLFIALFQFTYIPRVESDWTKTKLFMRAWDTFFTLDEKGVNWLDPSEVQAGVSDALNNTNIQFGIRVRGAPPADISVGCICDTNDYNAVDSILTGFMLNGESINFTVQRIPTDNISFSHKHDVIIFFDRNVTAYRAEILNFLEAGKGLFENRDMGASDIDSVQSDIFGLSWNNSLTPNSNNISFTSYPDSKDSYTLYKYFHSIPNSSGHTYSKPYYFSNFIGNNRVWQKDNNADKIAMMQEGSGVPACIINHGMSGGFGRTVWVPSMGAIDSLDEDEKVLFNDMVLWSAGMEFDIVKSDIGNTIGRFSFFKILDQNMYQPIEIEMDIGYLY